LALAFSVGCLIICFISCFFDAFADAFAGAFTMIFGFLIAPGAPVGRALAGCITPIAMNETTTIDNLKKNERLLTSLCDSINYPQ
jgi:hypothetical protein